MYFFSMKEHFTVAHTVSNSYIVQLLIKKINI